MVTQLTNVVELSQAKRLAIGFGFSEGPPWHPEGYGLFVDVRANRTIRMKLPRRLSENYSQCLFGLR